MNSCDILETNLIYSEMIRAYVMQKEFIKESENRVDINQLSKGGLRDGSANKFLFAAGWDFWRHRWNL